MHLSVCLPKASVWLAALCVLAIAPAATACPCDQLKMPAETSPEQSISAGLEFSYTASYKREFAAAMVSAKKFCIKYKKEHPQARNLAIVSDVDETILDNREEFTAHQDNFVWEQFESWLKEARAPVLPKTAAFLKWARQHGFAILLVTGRPEVDRIWTIENLVREGVAYDALYLRPSLRPDNDDIPAANYKSETRKTIEQMGFTIVVNIGDQISDLAGGHSLDCEKLPNKMYFLK